MNNDLNNVERVIGFDSHPDSFTAALLQGKTPAEAVVEKTFNKVTQIASVPTNNKSNNDSCVFKLSANDAATETASSNNRSSGRSKNVSSINACRTKYSFWNSFTISFPVLLVLFQIFKSMRSTRLHRRQHLQQMIHLRHAMTRRHANRLRADEQQIKQRFL